MERLAAVYRMEIVWQKARYRSLFRSFYQWKLYPTVEALSSANLTLEAVTKQFVQVETECAKVRAAKSLDFLAKTIESEIQGIKVSRAMITVAFEDFMDRVRDMYTTYAIRSRQNGRIGLSDVSSLFREYRVFRIEDMDMSRFCSNRNNVVDLTFTEFIQGITNLLSSMNHGSDEVQALRASELVWKRLSRTRVPKLPLLVEPKVDFQQQSELLDALEHETEQVARVVMRPTTSPILVHILCRYEKEVTSVFMRYAVQTKVSQKGLFRFFHDFELVPELFSHAKALELYREARNNQPLGYADFIELLCECARHVTPEKNLTRREMLLTLLFHIGVKRDEICFLSIENETVLWALFQHYAVLNKQNQWIMNDASFKTFVTEIAGYINDRLPSIPESPVGFEGFCKQLGTLQQMVDPQQGSPLGEQVSRWIRSIQTRGS